MQKQTKQQTFLSLFLLKLGNKSGWEMVGKSQMKVLKVALNQGFWAKSNCEARHGKGFEGLLKRYFN